MAWHRTAALIKNIMESVFELLVFSYVDDFFWVSVNDPKSGVNAAWLQQVFRQVAQDLLGWKLDPAKDEAGPCVTLLGLEISLNSNESRWRLNPQKATEWVSDMYHVLSQDWLTPATANKIAGRMSF